MAATRNSNNVLLPYSPVNAPKIVNNSREKVISVYCRGIYCILGKPMLLWGICPATSIADVAKGARKERAGTLWRQYYRGLYPSIADRGTTRSWRFAAYYRQYTML